MGAANLSLCLCGLMGSIWMCITGDSMTDYEEVQLLAQQLTALEKARLLEFLSISIKQELLQATHRQIPWEQFIALTYGSLAHDPLERDQPTQSDARDWDI